MKTKSARTKGPWSRPGKLYKLVDQVLRDAKRFFNGNNAVLDYGCGPKAAWTAWLTKRHPGFYIEGYDIIDPHRDNSMYYIQWPMKVFERPAEDQPFSFVIASRVMNVQHSREEVAQTIIELWRYTDKHGMCLVDYPTTPRYVKDLSLEDIIRMFGLYYETVDVIDGTCLVCKYPRGK